MKNILLFCLICLGVTQLTAQNRLEAKKENKDKLYLISQNYLAEFPDDKRALDLHNKMTAVKSQYIAYLNKISNGSYEHFGTKGRVDFEMQTNGTDIRASKMATVVDKTFIQYKEYFMQVSIPFKNQVTLFTSQLRSGRYGKKSDVKLVRRKRS